MEIKIYAEIEVPVDDRFSRTDYVTITLGDEAISLIAKAIAAQQTHTLDGARVAPHCEHGYNGSCPECSAAQTPPAANAKSVRPLSCKRRIK